MRASIVRCVLSLAHSSPLQSAVNCFQLNCLPFSQHPLPRGTSICSVKRGCTLNSNILACCLFDAKRTEFRMKSIANWCATPLYNRTHRRLEIRGTLIEKYVIRLMFSVGPIASALVNACIMQMLQYFPIIMSRLSVLNEHKKMIWPVQSFHWNHQVQQLKLKFMMNLTKVCCKINNNLLLKWTDCLFSNQV